VAPRGGAGSQINSNYLILSQIISKKAVARSLALAIFEQVEGGKMEAERRPLSPEG
jgi:hypothetical protein